MLLLVGGALFEFATGVLNIQLFYPWHFGFVRAHYYGAWVFIAALVTHVAVKLPTVRGAYRAHGVLRPLRDNLAHTRPAPYEPGGLAPSSPAAPTISRRGLIGDGRRRLAGPAGGQPRGVDRRSAAPLRVAGAPRPRVRHRPQRLSGQQDRGVRQGHQAGQRPGLEADGRGPQHATAQPRRS